MSQLASFNIFQPGYSQVATTALQAANGDFLLAGRLSPQNGPSMGTALRLRGGNVVWEKNYPGQFYTSFSSMAALPKDTFILTGTYNASNRVGDEKIWLVNLDGAGNVIWEGQYGYPGHRNDGFAVVATSDGGFVFVAQNVENGVDKIPTTLVWKFDAQRKLQWRREFLDGVSFAIAQTSDGGYILSGAHRIVGSLNSNPYVLRLDPNGNKIWSRAFTLEIYALLRSSVTQTRDGNFLVTAMSALIKVDGAGNIIWQRRNDRFDLHSVLELPDQSIAVGGVFGLDNNGHAYVAVLNATGENIQWDNTALQLPSAFTQLFLDRRYRLVAASGFGPLEGDRSQMLLAVFYPAKTFNKMAATPEPGASGETAAD
jgi:hypothetical protein